MYELIKPIINIPIFHQSVFFIKLYKWNNLSPLPRFFVKFSGSHFPSLNFGGNRDPCFRSDLYNFTRGVFAVKNFPGSFGMGPNLSVETPLVVKNGITS